MFEIPRLAARKIKWKSGENGEIFRVLNRRWVCAVWWIEKVIQHLCEGKKIKSGLIIRKTIDLSDWKARKPNQTSSVGVSNRIDHVWNNIISIFRTRLPVWEWIFTITYLLWVVYGAMRTGLEFRASCHCMGTMLGIQTCTSSIQILRSVGHCRSHWMK